MWLSRTSPPLKYWLVTAFPNQTRETPLKKLLAVACSMLFALIVMDASQVAKSPTGLTVAQVGKGKAPIGKGKAPPVVVTKG